MCQLKNRPMYIFFLKDEMKNEKKRVQMTAMVISWIIKLFRDKDARQTISWQGCTTVTLNHSRLVLHLFLTNPLKPGVKSRMKM